MKSKIFFVTAMLIAICFSAVGFNARAAQEATTPINFAVIGDYGFAGANEAAVANLVKSWNPEFIVTVGDNNYDSGEAATIDANIGQYYHGYIFDYQGIYGAGSATNRFYPVLGNHDWATANAQPYLDYFTLPNNERYYDFVQGPVHFFMIDSDPNEPDGISADSVQGQWLKAKLQASTAPWRLVFFHHAAYSSADHGSNLSMQWQFANWGANAVLTGHDHSYERIQHDDIVYFVNGLGGRSKYNFPTVVDGSQIRYNAKYGAMKVSADATQINFKFIDTDGAEIDSYTLSDPYQGATNDAGVGIQLNSWKIEKNSKAYAGKYTSASQSKEAATFKTPASNTVTLVSYRGPNQGIAKVYIDGVFQESLDLYAAAPNYKYKRTYPHLTLKPHVVIIKPAGLKNPLSSGKQIRLDAIIAGGTTDNLSAKIKYSAWTGAFDASALGGSYRYSATKNAAITFTTTKTTVRIITARGPAYGNAILKVDGIAVKNVDLYSATPEWQYLAIVSGLSAGTHKIEWVVAGTKNAASTATQIVFDGYR